MSHLSFQVVLDRLHASDYQISIVVSGGGSGAIAKCFQRSGASKSFVEAVVAYSRGAMAEYLEGPPVGRSASIETARQLAEMARRRCEQLTDAEGFCAAGLALTAALPTTPPRNGRDQIHVALNREGATETWSKELRKGEFTRESAEALADEMFLRALNSMCD